MTLDPGVFDRNRAATQRMRALAGRLSAAQLRTPVGEHWDVAIVFAHLAFWDRRVEYVLDMTEQDGKLFIPEIDIFVNDLSLPLWAAIPPHDAVRIAIETAEHLDRHLVSYPPGLLQEIYVYNKRWVDRSLHRNEHLDEAEAGLRSGGR
jgi:hypothetical protein